ncbi:4173_t:CDS:1 [Funneliformis caledonium]|uniref:Large ribosomal subunit protein bL32m n=1 Tax=Funneliformis caledonium TaxID=1117310 RepID=A0A9N9F5B1_9GLOM|nr:4173_t:CDS:1 [Funneliformis caledonium]
MAAILSSAIFRRQNSRYISLYNDALISTYSTPLSTYMQTFWRDSQRKAGTLFGLAQILGPILWAVPKKKTSHSKKRMRSANKGLKDKTNIVDCLGCGQKHLVHHLCHNCYKDFKYREKMERDGLSFY